MGCEGRGTVVRAILRQQRAKQQVLEILRAIRARSTLFVQASLLAPIYKEVEQKGSIRRDYGTLVKPVSNRFQCISRPPVMLMAWPVM